jgi:hypothetical protein
MTTHTLDPDALTGWDRSAPIDWNRPEICALLKKTNGLKIEKRNAFDEKPVTIHIGWSTHIAGSHEGTLVSEADGQVVVEGQFDLKKNELVCIERQTVAGVRVLWGAVVDKKVGARANEQNTGKMIYWLAVKPAR